MTVTRPASAGARRPGPARVPPGHHGRPGHRSSTPAPGEQARGPRGGRHRRAGGAGGRGGGRAGRGGRIVRGAGASALAADPGRGAAGSGVHGRLRGHAAPAARGLRRPRGCPADAGHRLRGQRGVGLGAAGRTRPGHRLHLPPVHRAGRGPAAAWPPLAGGAASSAAAALVVVGGALASGNLLVAAVAVPGGVLAVAALVVAGAAARRPLRPRGALERPAAGRSGRGSRLLHRPGTEPGQIIRAWKPSGWVPSSFPRRAGRR